MPRFDHARALRFESSPEGLSALRDSRRRRANVMPPLLTPDAISRIMRGAQPDELRPLVQVFDLRPFKQKEEEVGQSPRFRMLASDGAHAVQGLFAGDLNAKCERDEIKRYSILRLENYQITPVGDKGDKKCVSRGIESNRSTTTRDFAQASEGNVALDDARWANDARARRAND